MKTETCDWREDWHWVIDSFHALLDDQQIIIDQTEFNRRVEKAANAARRPGLLDLFAVFESILKPLGFRIYQQETGGDFYCFSIVPFDYVSIEEIIQNHEREIASDLPE